MAPPLRIEFPGALYHVTSRGNARQRVFRDDEDRAMFLATLGRGKGDRGEKGTGYFSGEFLGRPRWHRVDSSAQEYGGGNRFLV